MGILSPPSRGPKEESGGRQEGVRRAVSGGAARHTPGDQKRSQEGVRRGSVFYFIFFIFQRRLTLNPVQ
jgi:hypothetical protein